MPSSNIYAKTQTFRFKIGPENRSKISQEQGGGGGGSARYEPVQGPCSLCMPASYGMRWAKINFSMFLTIFEYAEYNTERCYVQIFMQKLEFCDFRICFIECWEIIINAAKFQYETSHKNAEININMCAQRIKLYIKLHAWLSNTFWPVDFFYNYIGITQMLF